MEPDVVGRDRCNPPNPLSRKTPVTLASRAIKQADPKALILTPAVASGNHTVEWLEGALNAAALAGSPTFRKQGKPLEQTTVKSYIQELPDPFPMLPAPDRLTILDGQVRAFRHPKGPAPEEGQVWVIWAIVDTGDVSVTVPVFHSEVEIINPTGELRSTSAVMTPR